MVQSVLFRILLLVYSIVIVIRSQGLIDSPWFYAVAVVYFFVYLFIKKQEWSLVRLFVDFIFINLTLWGRDVYNPICFLFVLLPMINAVNFSGKHSRSFLLMALMTATFIINMGKFESWICLPLLSIWLIFFVALQKHKQWDLIHDITTHVDSYFVNASEIEKPHVIYKGIIKDLNKYLMLPKSKGISRISAYRLDGYTLWLINSSSFLWERRIMLDEKDLELLKAGKMINKMNDVFTDIFMLISGTDVDYVFCCEMYSDSKSLFVPLWMPQALKISFSKMALLLNAEYRIQKMRDEKFDEIKDNVLYVNKAVRIMHFIRNRLTPVKNLVTYQTKASEMAPEIRKLMDERISKEAKQADSDLTEILTTADYLLDKSNNPFVQPEIKESHFSKIFIVASEIVQRLLDGVVEADESLLQLMHENKDLVVSTNLIETKIMLADWINNMRKYKHDYYSISASHCNDILTVHFENNYEGDEDIIRLLVRDMNSTSKDAVIEGKEYGYGIYIIKSIAYDLKVDIFAEVGYSEKYGNLLCLDLNFKTHERETNSNL